MNPQDEHDFERWLTDRIEILESANMGKTPRTCAYAEVLAKYRATKSGHMGLVVALKTIKDNVLRLTPEELHEICGIATKAGLVAELRHFIDGELRIAEIQTHKEAAGFRQALNQVSKIVKRYEGKDKP